jgi:hypothetical protein
MTTVNGKLIGAANPERVEMVANLVDVTGKPAVGYVPTQDGEIVRPVPIQANSSGVWTVTLTANTLIESTSGDTLWAVQEGRALDGTPVLTHILVPEDEGPWWVGDLRIDLSDTTTGDGSIVYVPGPAGPAGPAGATGPEGPAGAAGAAGATGASAYEVAILEGFTGTEADWLASLTGPQGAAGPARPGLLSVNAQPDNSLGIDGDWAISPGERRIYGPKTAGAWTVWSRIDPPTEPGWQRNGFATLDGSDLYLTHAADGFGAGTCWRTTLAPTEGLDVSFTAEMSGGTGADGITFALADPATAATFQGGGGGDLGLVGCAAAALALDTGAGSRARLVTTTETAMTTIATYGGALDLRAAPVQVRVLYQAGKLSAWLDGTLLFDEVTVAAAANARIGWTGSNGGANDNHIIRDAAFVPKGGIQL